MMSEADVTYKDACIDTLRKFLAEKISRCDALKVELEQLREWKQIILGTGTDQESVIRLAATEYTKTAVECWRKENEKLKARVAELTKWYDATQGTPCEEIRNAQQVEALEAERDQLKHELSQANEACAALREDKPLGPVIGAQTILNQAKEIERLKAELATVKREVFQVVIDRIETTHESTGVLREWCRQNLRSHEGALTKKIKPIKIDGTLRVGDLDTETDTYPVYQEVNGVRYAVVAEFMTRKLADEWARWKNETKEA
jgi:predicted RNase H-like nuclease (RuvC/YqgF family)